MNERASQLPWDQLWHAEGPIPWSALETFAEAVATDADVVPELFEAYQKAREAWLEGVCYLDLYIPAIFALAAPRLGDEQRRIIGEFLLRHLMDAGEDDDDLALEVLTAACGALGPVILPAVLATIDREPEYSGAWFFLWSLTQLAARTEDPALRERTAQACVRLLERIERGEVEQDLGIEAAWTLALLGRTDQIELLQRLSRECPPFFGGADYRDAVDRMLGPLHYTPVPESWERPVREWLEPRWETARKWFAGREVRDFEVGSTELDEAFADFEPEAPDWDEPLSLTPPIPIVEHKPRIGRNDPCPCGSGRKYKKCCGSPTKDQPADV